MQRVLSTASLFTLAVAIAPSCVLVAESGPPVVLHVRVEAADSMQAWLNIEDVRLVHCEGEEMAARLQIGPSRAQALHPGNPEQLGEARVVALHEASTRLGVVHPPSGSYCGLEVFVTPSEALEGWTLVANYVGSGGADLALHGPGMRIWPMSFSEVMALDDAGRAVELVLHPARALEGIDLSTEYAGLDLLLALEASAEVAVR